MATPARFVRQRSGLPMPPGLRARGTAAYTLIEGATVSQQLSSATCGQATCGQAAGMWRHVQRQPGPCVCWGHTELTANIRLLACRPRPAPRQLRRQPSARAAYAPLVSACGWARGLAGRKLDGSVRCEQPAAPQSLSGGSDGQHHPGSSGAGSAGVGPASEGSGAQHASDSGPQQRLLYLLP